MKKIDFDQIYSRTNTDSIKWKRYPGDVLPLWVADMDFASPPEVAESIAKRISHPIFGYGGPDHDLHEVICEWVQKRYGWQIDTDWILLMPGVVTGMNLVARSFLKKSDSLIFHTPVYPPFFNISKNADARQIEIPMIIRDGTYQISFDQFEKAIQESTKLYFLCNPQNPVGRVFCKEELEEINEICLKKNVIICSDEIHCDLTFSGHPHIPIASLSEYAAKNTITLMAPSKTFNIPGLDFSFAVVPNPEHRQRMEKSRGGLVGHPNLLAAEAAKAVFANSADWLAQLNSYLEGNRDYLVDFIKTNLPEIKIIPPEGTYLAWLDCRELDLQPGPYEFFLEKAKVALNDGQNFGKNGAGFVRLNFGCQRQTLVDALERMAEAIYTAK